MAASVQLYGETRGALGAMQDPEDSPGHRRNDQRWSANSGEQWPSQCMKRHSEAQHHVNGVAVHILQSLAT